jgi:hypothetical protein
MEDPSALLFPKVNMVMTVNRFRMSSMWLTKRAPFTKWTNLQ